jgi:diacylglycerol kinase family enzyme
MDVGTCQGIPFLLWGGAGFDAFVVHHLEPRNRWQKQFPSTQYAANVAWFSRTFAGMDLKLKVDGEKMRGTYILALATNIHLYAGGKAEISPSAKLDDGAMDLWLFSGDSMLETLQHLFDLATGKHLDSKKTTQITCQEIEIKSNTDMFLQLDGEPVPPSRKVKFAIKPQALNVMVPNNLPRSLFMKDPL